jgi:heterodisulfide reductase subunit A
MVAEPTVVVIGGGIAGLSAAIHLADVQIRPVIVEKASFLGGHAVQYACKATEACVTCGACLVEQTRRRVLDDQRIAVSTNSRVADVIRSNGKGYRVAIDKMDPLEPAEQASIEAEAIIIATGFAPFDPVGKPYGWRHFANVVTNLQLEQLLREKSLPRCPSDNRIPEAIAFVQCVGSRDAKLGHLWCSKVCCASALRMAGLVKARRPETNITIFYIDIQTFGKDFDTQLAQLKDQMRLVRAIPGDIYGSAGDRLRVVYFHPYEKRSCEDLFDMVVLSVGMTPSPDNRALTDLFQLPTTASGFLEESEQEGVFVAGAAGGPMSIAESVASAGRAAFRVADYLRGAK